MAGVLQVMFYGMAGQPQASPDKASPLDGDIGPTLWQFLYFSCLGPTIIQFVRPNLPGWSCTGLFSSLPRCCWQILVLAVWLAAVICWCSR